jgi:hypothetical protein
LIVSHSLNVFHLIFESVNEKNMLKRHLYNNVRKINGEQLPRNLGSMPRPERLLFELRITKTL